MSMDPVARRSPADRGPAAAARRPGRPLRVLVPLAVLALLGTLGAVKATQIRTLIGAGKAMQAAGPPPENIGAATATKASWEETIAAVGSVEAGRGVTLSNDAPGLVTRIHFESGQHVEQGDVLVELDTRVERAELAAALARRDLAGTNAKRSKALVAASVAPASQLDADEATLRTSAADAATLVAQIERKTVRAPFTGTLGIRLVNVGQYLNPGTALAVLQSTEGTFVDFTVPQERLNDVAIGVPVRLRLGAGAALEGKVAAVDPAVDETTRAVKVRATADDPDRKLRPGMFVQVSVVLPAKRTVVVVPARALVHASYGDSVFVLEEEASKDGKPAPGLKARQQFVRTGELRGDFVAIEAGLAGGERIATAGAFKLRNGSRAVIGDDVGRIPELAPTPQNR